jgi:hypothetical protein
MKKLEFTETELNWMQEVRDSGVSLRDMSKMFECSTSFICRHTLNPNRLLTPEQEEARRLDKMAHSARERRRLEKEERLKANPPVFLPKKKKNKAERKLRNDGHVVRVLTSVPENFKAPTRGMGW